MSRGQDLDCSNLLELSLVSIDVRNLNVDIAAATGYPALVSRARGGAATPVFPLLDQQGEMVARAAIFPC